MFSARLFSRRIVCTGGITVSRCCCYLNDIPVYWCPDQGRCLTYAYPARRLLLHLAHHQNLSTECYIPTKTLSRRNSIKLWLKLWKCESHKAKLCRKNGDPHKRKTKQYLRDTEGVSLPKFKKAALVSLSLELYLPIYIFSYIKFLFVVVATVICFLCDVPKITLKYSQMSIYSW